MLDEFPALGRLDFFETALAFLAGYGIRAFLIGQSLNQIEKAYGPNNAILDNCHVRVAFATNDERTAKRISDSLGAKTELRSQKNYTGHRLAPWLSHMMVSRQETARQLLTPGEVMQLPPKQEVVMVAGVPPVMASKLRYFKDHNFKDRVLPPAQVALEGEGPASFWLDKAEPEASAAMSVDASAEDGGKDLRPELDQQPAREIEVEAAEIDLSDDDPLDPTDAQHLETLRRAIALDQTDSDVFPEF
jgi:type IV secretion system protein VirD4